METNQGYRKTITKICEKLGYDIIDPWLREKSYYKGDEKWWWPNVPVSGFFRRDLEDAERCDIMIVYLPKLSAGACMELFYAKRKGKKILVISEMKSLSPWIKIHSDVILKNFSDIENELKIIQ